MPAGTDSGAVSDPLLVSPMSAILPRAAPLPPCPGEYPSTRTPRGEHPSALIPLGEHLSARCLAPLPAPTWDAADPWDSNPRNTCRRETINSCPPTAQHPQLRAPPATSQPAGVALTPIRGVPSTHLTAPRARRPGGGSPPACRIAAGNAEQEKNVPSESRGGGMGGTLHP